MAKTSIARLPPYIVAFYGLREKEFGAGYDIQAGNVAIYAISRVSIDIG
jgi:hypothetical protein